MPDPKDKDLADADEVPDTPLHAHTEGREDDVVGTPTPEVGEEGDLDVNEDQDPPANPVGGDEDKSDESESKSEEE